MDAWSRGRVCGAEYLKTYKMSQYIKNVNVHYGHYDYDYVFAVFGYLETFEQMGKSLLMESAMQQYYEYYLENADELQHQKQVDFLL